MAAPYDDESHLLCACRLLNYDGRPRAMINHRLLAHSKWCKTEKKEKSEPSRISNPGHTRFISHYSTKASQKGGNALVLLTSLGYIVVQYAGF
jgi:hypothetical protein